MVNKKLQGFVFSCFLNLRNLINLHFFLSLTIDFKVIDTSEHTGKNDLRRNSIQSPKYALNIGNVFSTLCKVKNLLGHLNLFQGSYNNEHNNEIFPF